MRLPPILERILNRLQTDRQTSVNGLRADLQELIHAIRDQQATQREHPDSEQHQSNLPERILRAERQLREYEQRENRTYGNLQLWIQIILAIATWLAFIAAAVYAGIAAEQLDQMREATHQATVAARAARRSADTAKGILDANREQFRLQQRPYIWAQPHSSITPGGPVVVPIPNQPSKYGITVSVDIWNGGISPAVHVINTSSIIKVGTPNELAKIAENYTPVYPKHQAGSLIGPNTSNTVSSERKPTIISFDEHKQWVDGTLGIIVIGGVQYHDMFPPPAKPYETTYCFTLNPQGMHFGTCRFGNSMK